MASLKFPGRAFFFKFAFLFFPAVFTLEGTILPLISQQEIHLSFHMHGDGPPALFVALNRFQRNTKQCRQFFLCLVEPCPGLCKCFFIHCFRVFYLCICAEIPHGAASAVLLHWFFPEFKKKESPEGQILPDQGEFLCIHTVGCDNMCQNSGQALTCSGDKVLSRNAV